MSRRPARFTEADAVRAANAAKRAGMAVKIDSEGAFWLIPLDFVPPPTLQPNPEPLAGKKTLVF
ncbi:hypothetical protein SAMN06265338_108153 [Rhodoblastus acidophilus]|uniref:Uncharacterized protein n=1 Tax=Rhodoblastus acidophilus TaxID=1074 RepID=A0A212RY03_RHOAC|nr:hypothetical protein CKO16_10690 [Rhodoblastus acidophilus]RAI17252.1 hypothetical protein CH337_17135 [Rhodoblastus acidophilus]SNB77536.1 hypothetical protein SAMN06265338_108153 [Rhodoblastus acidophilus]